VKSAGAPPFSAATPFSPTAVEALCTRDLAIARRVGMHPCRLYSGLTLREIGAAYGMGESSVRQASRGVDEEIKNSESVRESIGMLERDVGVSKRVTPLLSLLSKSYTSLQSSSTSPGTRSNSPILFVTNIRPDALA